MKNNEASSSRNIRASRARRRGTGGERQNRLAERETLRKARRVAVERLDFCAALGNNKRRRGVRDRRFSSKLSGVNRRQKQKKCQETALFIDFAENN